MAGEQAKDQHSQLEQIAGGSGAYLTKQHLGGNKTWSPQHRALTPAVNIDVIVIADKNASTVRIYEQVSKGDILIAEPFEMKLVEAIR